MATYSGIKKEETFKAAVFRDFFSNPKYAYEPNIDDAGFSLYKEVGFNDNQKAHKAFWDKYERPPLEEFWDYIINRRDLLLPQDIMNDKSQMQKK